MSNIADIAELHWPVVTGGGVAGLAVRLGRALEEWGQRASSPAVRAELDRRRDLEVAAQRDRAAQNGALRAGFRGF